MNIDREQVVAWAREARLLRTGDGWTEPYRWGASELERFAALVAVAEREAIAKRFDGPVWSYDYREIAAAIRAKENT